MKKIAALLVTLLLLNGLIIAVFIQKIYRGDYLITNTNNIEGYSDKISYFAGDKVELMIHCIEPSFDLEVTRYGKEKISVKSVANLPGMRQDYPPNASEKGAGWKTSYSLEIPADWENGLYSAKLSDKSGNTSYITFVVKGSKENLRGDIALLASTNTWQAYNGWGGISFYENLLDDDEPYFGSGIVSMLRPNPQGDPTDGNGHTAGAELHILSWLEEQGHPYKLLADYDLDKDPALLDRFKVLIISTHNEYWTDNMYDALENFLNKGGNLLYLSGDGVYWKALINDKNQIEARKDFRKHRFDGSQGGYWAKQLKRPESRVLGVRFQNSDYSVHSPYKVVNPDHWIFAGTGLKKDDLFGKTGLNKNRGFSGGASGWETDQMDENSPKNCVLLAKGANTKGKGAHMVYYEHPGGGGVFSAGSITFGGSLASDKELTIMVNNVINRFLTK